MSRIQALAALIALSVIAGVASWKVFFQHSDSVQQEEAGRFAPDFRLEDSNGKTRSLSEFESKVVILHFWASWCPPCLDEIPHWVELSNTFKDKKIQLVAVSLDQNWEDASKILPPSKLTPNLTSLLDKEAKTPDLYGSFQFPETYLLSGGKKRQILAKWVGPQDWNSPKIKQAIDSALALLP